MIGGRNDPAAPRSQVAGTWLPGSLRKLRTVKYQATEIRWRGFGSIKSINSRTDPLSMVEDLSNGQSIAELMHRTHRAQHPSLIAT